MMIQEKRIVSLLDEWKHRVKGINSEEYNCALGECIWELQKLLDNTQEEEDYLNDILANLPTEDESEHLLEQEIEEYLSHNSVA